MNQTGINSLVGNGKQTSSVHSNDSITDKTCQSFWESPDIITLRIDQVPPNGSKWAFEPLYNFDVNDNPMVWQIGFDGTHMQLKHGRYDTQGIIFSKRLVELNGSGRNIYEQSVLEIRRKYLDRYKKDQYRPAGCENQDRDVEPEAGYAYSVNGVVKCPISRFPVAVIAKADGWRLRFRLRNGRPVMTSRENHDLSHLTHLVPELTDFFHYLPADSFLECELYNKDIGRNQLQSIITTWKKGRHPLLEMIECYIFDIYWPEAGPFEDRYNLLCNAYSRYLEDGYKNTKFFLFSASLAYSVSEIEDFHNHYVSEGFEGVIIRKLAGPPGKRTTVSIKESLYKPGRSKNMIKYKHFEDEEGTIISVYGGKGTEENLAVFEMEDSDGNRFGVRPRGKFENRREWFKNPERVLGRVYTYRFFERSDKGIPIQPTGVGFRDPLM